MNAAFLKKTGDRLKKFWSDRDSFTFLLIILALYNFVLVHLVSGIAGEILFILFFYLLLSGSVAYLEKRKRKLILLVLTLTPVILLIIDLYFNTVGLAVSVDFFVEFYCIGLSGIILVRTFSKGHLRLHRVQGAIVAYLLISFTFAMIYHTIYLIGGRNAFHGLMTAQRTEFMYYSLSTITTVAFGDITPVNAFARSISNLEGLTGQLYPAILIARLVSMGMNSPGQAVSPNPPYNTPGMNP